MYCKNCGNQISENDVFCVNCGASVGPPEQPQPRYQPPAQPQPAYQPPAPQYQQQVYAQQPVMVQDKGVYGRFGGLFIFGALIIVMLLVGMISSDMFLSSMNLANMFKSLVLILPVAFSVALTVKTKGLDFSFPAMVALTQGIIMANGSLGTGLAIAAVVCVIIGIINAVGIHFLKLPGILFTMIVFFIIRILSSLLLRGGAMVQMRLDPALLYVAVLIAAVIAVAVALVSSIAKDHRNKFWSVMLTYLGSGLMAVLYCFALAARVQGVVSTINSTLVTDILIIALFLGITRFFKSKGLGLVFAIIPSIYIILAYNLIYLMGAEYYIVQISLTLFIIAMVFLIMYRGRAQLEGQSLDIKYRAKSWIALIPLFVFLLISFVLVVILAANMGRPPMIYYTLSGIYSQAAMLLVTIGLSIAYMLMKPKGSTIV